MGDTSQAGASGTTTGSSTAPIALAAIGGGYQAYSQVRSGNLNARVADANASIADLQALDAQRRGDLTAGKARRDATRAAGAQRAAAAGAGVQVDSGSAGDLVTETQDAGRLDEVTARNNARLEAWGYRVQANSSRAQASLDRGQGYEEAGGTIITSGARISGYMDGTRRNRGSGR